MGFFERLFGLGGNKLFTDKREPKLACALTLFGQTYLVSQFDLNLNNNLPQAYVVLEEPVSAQIESWISSTKTKTGGDGNFRFYDTIEALNEGSSFELSFKEAKCSSYKKNIQGSTTIVTLTMVFGQLNINGEDW